MGTIVDRSVTWETGLEGMRSSAGKIDRKCAPPWVWVWVRQGRRHVARVGDQGAEPRARRAARANGARCERLRRTLGAPRLPPHPRPAFFRAFGLWTRADRCSAVSCV
eukprot:scaffold80203_cov73-Phaeocystis_antarctica.AAC.7